MADKEIFDGLVDEIVDVLADDVLVGSDGMERHAIVARWTRLVGDCLSRCAKVDVVGEGERVKDVSCRPAVLVRREPRPSTVEELAGIARAGHLLQSDIDLLCRRAKLVLSGMERSSACGFPYDKASERLVARLAADVVLLSKVVLGEKAVGVVDGPEGWERYTRVIRALVEGPKTFREMRAILGLEDKGSSDLVRGVVCDAGRRLEEVGSVIVHTGRGLDSVYEIRVVEGSKNVGSEMRRGVERGWDRTRRKKGRVQARRIVGMLDGAGLEGVTSLELMGAVGTKSRSVFYSWLSKVKRMLHGRAVVRSERIGMESRYWLEEVSDG